MHLWVLALAAGRRPVILRAFCAQGSIQRRGQAYAGMNRRRGRAREARNRNAPLRPAGVEAQPVFVG